MSGGQKTAPATEPARPVYRRLVITAINAALSRREGQRSLLGRIVGADINTDFLVAIDRSETTIDDLENRLAIREIIVREIQTELAAIDRELAELGYVDDEPQGGTAAEPGLPLGGAA